MNKVPLLCTFRGKTDQKLSIGLGAKHSFLSIRKEFSVAFVQDRLQSADTASGHALPFYGWGSDPGLGVRA